MMAGSVFNGDDNRQLMALQHEMYMDSVAVLFSNAKELYLVAEKLIGVDTELGRLVSPVTGFDHRTLQTAHDIMAAQFRFITPYRPLLPNEYESKELGKAWRDWLVTEVNSLITDPRFTQAVLVATGCKNTDRGYAAEKELRKLLLARYSELMNNASSSFLQWEL